MALLALGAPAVCCGGSSGVRGGGWFQPDATARPMDGTRVMRTFQIGECQRHFK